MQPILSLMKPKLLKEPSLVLGETNLVLRETWIIQGVIQPSKWMDTRDSLWLTLTVMINFGRLIPSMQTKPSEIWDMLLLEYQDIPAGIMRDSFHPWDGTGQWVTLGIKSQATT